MILELCLLVLAQVDAGRADALPPPIEPREAVHAEDDAESKADAGVDRAVDGAVDDAIDAGPVAVAQLTLSATVEPPVATFGEPFALVVTIVRERGVRLQMPGSLPDIEGAPRMEGNAGPAETRAVEELPDGRVKETIRVPYLALDTVDLKTPAFALTSKDGTVVDVPSLTIKVLVPPDAPDAGPALTKEGAVVLAPAAGSIAYPVPDARPWVALSSLLSAGLLYAAARAAARRRRMRAPAVPVAPPPPPRPAHEVALERLEALLASGLLARGETAAFVERLMDEVLRDYLTARFALSAGTRTTRELVKDLLGVSVAGLDIALVETLLVDTDLVKFARKTIAPERAHAMATRVRALVEATRVLEVGGAGRGKP